MLAAQCPNLTPRLYGARLAAYTVAGASWYGMYFSHMWLGARDALLESKSAQWLAAPCIAVAVTETVKLL